MKHNKLAVLSLTAAILITFTSCSSNAGDKPLSISNITTTASVALETMPWETTQVGIDSNTLGDTQIEYAPLLATPLEKATYTDTPTIWEAINSKVSMGTLISDVSTLFSENTPIRVNSDAETLANIISDDLIAVLYDYYISNFGTGIQMIIPDFRDVKYDTYYVVDKDGTPYCFCNCEAHNNGIRSISITGDASPYIQDYADCTFSYALSGRIATFYALYLILGDSADNLISQGMLASTPSTVFRSIDSAIRRRIISIDLPSGISTYEDVLINDLTNKPEFVKPTDTAQWTLSNSEACPRWKPALFWEDLIDTDTLVQEDGTNYRCLGKPFVIEDAPSKQLILDYMKTALPELLECVYLNCSITSAFELDSIDVSDIMEYSSGDILACVRYYWLNKDTGKKGIAAMHIRYGTITNDWTYALDTLSLLNASTVDE